MGFLSHNSDSRYARRSIKSSKDADDRLVSTKILSQKWLIGLAPGRQSNGKVSQRCKNVPSLLRHQQKIPNPNQIKILNSKLEGLPNP